MCLNLPPRRSLGLLNELTNGLSPELRSQDKVVPSTEAGGRLFVSCRVNTVPLTLTPVRSRQRLTAESPVGPHVRYLSLNCGGLSSEVYQELLLTLDALPASTRPHLVAVQETHWSEDSATEYTTGSWQVISSHRHGYKAAAGVLVLVHRTLLRDAVLAYAEAIPGTCSARSYHAQILGP